MSTVFALRCRGVYHGDQTECSLMHVNDPLCSIEEERQYFVSAFLKQKGAGKPQGRQR